jgi:hypothetical protein
MMLWRRHSALLRDVSAMSRTPAVSSAAYAASAHALSTDEARSLRVALGALACFGCTCACACAHVMCVLGHANVSRLATQSSVRVLDANSVRSLTSGSRALPN